MNKQAAVLAAAISLVTAIALSGCAGIAKVAVGPPKHAHNASASGHGTNHHSSTHHSDASESLEGLQEAVNPRFEVGSEVTIATDHMDGMYGARATITGAYSTIIYAVTYTPTTGGEQVNGHKWVIQEEIKDAGDKLLQPGSRVILQAGHMEGMKGAEAVIDTAERTTVYSVNYVTSNGKQVSNHKWVAESELKS